MQFLNTPTIPFERNKVKSIDNIDLGKYSLVIWLSTSPYPKTATKILAYQPDELATDIIEQSNTNTIFYLNKELSSNSMVNERFPEQLLQLLNLYQLDNDQLANIDKRSISKAELLPNFVSELKSLKTSTRIELSKWLWLLFIPILLLERILARQRKQ